MVSRFFPCSHSGLTFTVSHKSLSLSLTLVVIGGMEGMRPRHTQRSFGVAERQSREAEWQRAAFLGSERGRANPSVAETSARIRHPSQLRSSCEGRLLIPRPAHSQLAAGQVAAAAQQRAWRGTLGRRETRTTPCAPSGAGSELRAPLPSLGECSGTFWRHGFPRDISQPAHGDGHWVSSI